MKIRKEILIISLAVMFLPLTSGGGFAQINVGDYTLGGDIELGGRFFINAPSHQDRGYFEEYIPYPTGVLLEQLNLLLTNKDGRDYYKFFMSRPGERDEDFLLQAGKIGVYKLELEYDQLQHLYSTVNPTVDEIMVLWQRLRFSGDYTPTPEIDVSADYTFLKKTGELPQAHNAGPPNAYGFTSILAPVDYSQNNLSVGADYSKPMYQFHLGYDLALFQDANQLVQAPLGTNNPFTSLPPGNMAQYVTASGAVNLPAKTRISGSFSYGWLTQDDTVFDEHGAAVGNADLNATTADGYFSAISRPCDPLTVRISYRVYDFENDNNLMNPLLLSLFGPTTSNTYALLKQEQYSYLRQAVNVAADWKFNSKAAVDVGYTYDETDRNEGLGITTNNTPKVGLRLYPYDWLNLIVNYAYSNREGNDFLSIAPVPLTYRFFAGDDRRNVVNFIAEAFPLNNVTFSVNFNLYDDSYNNSGYGLLSDSGWSAGADANWTPYKGLSLALGYVHEEAKTNELANVVLTGVTDTSNGAIGDLGPVLLTADSYDTVTARADIVLVPDKLNLTTRGSYSYSDSNFHNPLIPNLNESFLHIDTFLTYHFDKCWAFKVGYIFEQFNMTNAYQQLYTTPINADGTTPSTANQTLATLEGFYRDYTAHVIEALVQYKF